LAQLFPAPPWAWTPLDDQYEDDRDRRGGTHVDKRIRPEQVPHAPALDVIQHGRLQVDLDGPRDVFLVGDFVKVDGQSVELDVGLGFGAGVFAGFCAGGAGQMHSWLAEKGAYCRDRVPKHHQTIHKR
jgi:hypothetical protein